MQERGKNEISGRANNTFYRFKVIGHHCMVMVARIIASLCWFFDLFGYRGYSLSFDWFGSYSGFLRERCTAYFSEKLILG